MARDLFYVDIEREKCNNCGICISIAPAVFGKSLFGRVKVKGSFDVDNPSVRGSACTAAGKCPCKCISIYEF